MDGVARKLLGLAVESKHLHMICWIEELRPLKQSNQYGSAPDVFVVKLLEAQWRPQAAASSLFLRIQTASACFVAETRTLPQAQHLRLDHPLAFAR